MRSSSWQSTPACHSSCNPIFALIRKAAARPRGSQTRATWLSKTLFVRLSASDHVTYCIRVDAERECVRLAIPCHSKDLRFNTSSKYRHFFWFLNLHMVVQWFVWNPTFGLEAICLKNNIKIPGHLFCFGDFVDRVTNVVHVCVLLENLCCFWIAGLVFLSGFL